MDLQFAFTVLSGTCMPVLLYLTKNKLESIDRRLERLESVYFPVVIKPTDTGSNGRIVK